MQAVRIGRYGEPITKRTLAEHLCELGQELQMFFGRVLGNEQDEDLSDRLAIGRVERNRLPRPVEPSFSRANRLSNTTERAICAWSSKSWPTCSKSRFLLVASRSSRMFASGSSCAIWFTR